MTRQSGNVGGDVVFGILDPIAHSIIRLSEDGVARFAFAVQLPLSGLTPDEAEQSATELGSGVLFGVLNAVAYTIVGRGED